MERSLGWMAAALVAVAAGTGGWWIARSSAPAAEATAGVSGADAPLDAATPPPRATASAPVAKSGAAKPAFTPLPSLDTPLRIAQPELIRRADAGDGAAGCRLAAEWQYCRSVQQSLQALERDLRPETAAAEDRVLQQLDPTMRERARTARSARLDSARQRVDSLMDRYAHCDGVELGDAVQTGMRWRQAALNGNVVALRQYIAGNAISFNESLNGLPVLSLYRREAEALAWQAADAGDPVITLALAYAYDPDNPRGPQWLSQVVEPDPVAALALLLRVQGAGHPGQAGAVAESQLSARVERLSTNLTPQQLEQARTRASAGKPMPPLSLAMGTTTLAMGIAPPMGRELCMLSKPLTGIRPPT